MSYGFGKLNEYAQVIHNCAKSKGYWEGLSPSDVNTRLIKLALITEEIGEAVSAVRYGDNKNFAEELADIVICVMDLAEACEFNLEQEVVNKTVLTDPTTGKQYFAL